MIISSQTGSLGLPTPVRSSEPVRAASAAQEWVIEAACFLLSVAAAGVLSMALLAAAELPALTHAPVNTPAQSVPGGHA